jgi:CMP-N-acetylneuraminic acid synthetase
VDEKWDSVWTVSPADLKFHPLKQLRVSEKGKLDYYDSRGSGIFARQQLEQLYYRNGASYAVSRECLLGQKKLLGENSGALIVDEPLISIDTIEDFNKVEGILNRTLEQCVKDQRTKH